MLQRSAGGGRHPPNGTPATHGDTAVTRQLLLYPGPAGRQPHNKPYNHLGDAQHAMTARESWPSPLAAPSAAPNVVSSCTGRSAAGDTIISKRDRVKESKQLPRGWSIAPPSAIICAAGPAASFPHGLADNSTGCPTDGPACDLSLGPALSPTLGPALGPALGPTLDPAFNPALDPALDPTHNPTLDPTFDPDHDQ